MISFILIRHGETMWSKEKRYQGNTDVPLSTEGEKEVRRLSRVFGRYEPHVVYTSALSRAKESGDILCKSIAIKPKEDIRLNELGFGEWEGKTAEGLIKAKDPLYAKWMTGQFVRPPQGESVNSLRKRVQSFLKDCVKKNEGKTVAIVSHGGVLRVLITEILGLPRKNLFTFKVETGTMSVLTLAEGFGQLLMFNAIPSQRGKKSVGC